MTSDLFLLPLAKDEAVLLVSLVTAGLRAIDDLEKAGHAGIAQQQAKLLHSLRQKLETTLNKRR